MMYCITLNLFATHETFDTVLEAEQWPVQRIQPQN